MIYEFPDSTARIRQGDIFFPLPRIEFDMEEIPVFSDDPEGITAKNWDEISEDVVSANVPLAKTWAIVASQDCDTTRSPYISLFQIDTVSSVLVPDQIPKNEKSWKNWITQKCMKNAKWFYLPDSEEIGFSEKMLVTFERVIQIPRESLERRIETHRKGRLNDVADEHYRESIAEFFRRYPYNEWYPLDNAEFVTYSEKYPGSQPYPWQSS